MTMTPTLVKPAFTAMPPPLTQPCDQPRGKEKVFLLDFYLKNRHGNIPFSKHYCPRWELSSKWARKSYIRVILLDL